jgi:hypothetical protein
LAARRNRTRGECYTPGNAAERSTIQVVAVCGVFVDRGRTSLVLRPVCSAVSLSTSRCFPQVMALAASCAVLLAVGLSWLVATAAGHHLLRWWRLEFASDGEHLLCCAGLGVVGIEVLLFFAQIPGRIRLGVVAAIGVVVLFALGDIFTTLARVYAIAWRAMHGSRWEKLLIVGCLVVLAVEGLAAMAPLTGSDALHYHFAAPLSTLRNGFHPNFFLSYSFFTGQSHLLVLAGLALGSEKFAMGLLFLGGALAAAAGACLARRWVDRTWAWLVALLFLVTPVVFWQISAAGAPDLWLAFFATTGAVVISRAMEMDRLSLALATGALAGAAAGTKYTGCFLALGMLVAYLWEAKWSRKSPAFLVAALCAGVWPYVRNFLWTGDPVFPLLLPRLSPGHVNAFTLGAFLGDTGASGHHGFWQVIASPFFAAIDQAHFGFWQFLGPLVLAFAPLLLLSLRNTPGWRTTLWIWGLTALCISATSGMTRFLLPVLPLALAAVIAGVAQLKPRGWLHVHHLAVASMCLFVAFGVAGLFSYDGPALAAVIGMTAHDAYLRSRAPQYEDSQFVNRTLQNRDAGGETLVFLRHVYYLRVPFLYADPSASWAIDPSRLRTAEQWRRLFKEQGVHWVLRAPDYPLEIAKPLVALEAQGKLVPIARERVSDFRGMRLTGDRRIHEVVILEVRD